MQIFNDIESFGKENKMFKKYYWGTKVRMILTTIVIIGALNWGTTALGYNLVELLSKNLNGVLKTDYPFDKIIYIIVAICGILLASRRTTWLPFLGKSVFPESLVPLKTPVKSDMKVSIKTKPNVKIAYWAALPKGENPDVITAYGDFSNSGVVMSDSNGIAELPILVGSGYTVPSGRKIDRHVHYRVLDKPYGMMGKIKTKNY
jgi:uncharacterized membrane protein YuzA (DUF378 family)